MRESFDLKLDRAEHHLQELKGEIRRFASRHAYEAVPVASTNRKTGSAKFKLKFNEHPPEMLPVIVGDVVHNVRSALDHLIVANVPRKYRWGASFPVFMECPYGDDGVPFDNELGKTWNKAVAGLRESLLTQVKMLQPFQKPDDDTLAFCVAHGVEPNDIQALAFLSRFDNADKHRELITVPHGLENAVVTFWASGDQPNARNVQRLPFFCEDGEQLVAIDRATIPKDAQMNVEVRGTVRVAIRIREASGVAGLPGTLEKVIAHAREIVASFRAHRGTS
jgi:hypothetical protein